MGVLFAARHRHPDPGAEVVVDLAIRAALAHGTGCFGRVVVVPGDVLPSGGA
jgi:hypothetical protein